MKITQTNTHMAENPKFFQITSAPKKASISGRITKLYRKRQLVISVIGAYVLIGGLLGYLLFNSTSDSAKAGNETARVTPVIDLVQNSSEQSPKLGDSVEVKLTLQNRSNTESINNLTVEFFSTKNSINWSEIGSFDSDKVENIPSQSGVFKLPILTSGERSEYVAKGVLQNDDTNFLTILAKIRYLNKEGQQEVNSNRVFTELQNNSEPINNILSLSIAKDTYLPGEEVPVTLDVPDKENLPEDFKLTGKIYLSRKENDVVVDSLRCDLDQVGTCTQIFKSLEPGSYTLLFVNDDENRYSEIVEFVVSGNTSTFTINPQATLDFPFGSRSINGIVPVAARRVIGLNDQVKADDLCTFVVKKGELKVTEVQTKVESDRTCRTIINTSQLPDGEGVYQVTLEGSEVFKEVSFARKPSALVNLQTSSAKVSKGSGVDLLVTGITNIDTTPVNNDGVVIGIWHQSSGDYTEISSQNGEKFEINNGQFNARLNSENFSKGGLFSLYIKSDNGTQSEFLNVNFDDKEAGFVYSGVIVEDYSKLKVGEDTIFRLQGITDKAGNQVTEGECTAAIYPRSSSSTAIVIEGVISNGNCQVIATAGTITKNGPVLVSFTAPEVQNSINQSRQFLVSSGDVVDFGGINLEYEPVRRNFANSVIIGPLTDSYNNLTDANNLKLSFSEDGIVIREFTDIKTESGYARLTIPSNILSSENITISLKDSEDREIATRDIATILDETKLNLPELPDTLNGNEKIKAVIKDINPETDLACKLTYIRTPIDTAEMNGIINPEEKTCEFDWDLGVLRDVNKAMLQLEIGDKKHSKVINMTSGDAANLFVMTPNIWIDSQDSIHLTLLSSVVTDKYGLPLQSGKARVEFNGKANEVSIKNGMFSQFISSTDLSNKDIRSAFGSRFLDLSIEASAGVTSISKTNNLTIFLGEKDLATNSGDFQIVDAESHILDNSKHVFGFNSDICNVLLVSANKTETRLLKTHKQGGMCYVQVDGVNGTQSLEFEKDGQSFGSFAISSTNLKGNVSWCEASPCLIQVNAPINSKINIRVLDGENEYLFQSKELENVVRVGQNGLNPLKKYLVEVSYENTNGENVQLFRSISGEYLNSEVVQQ